MKQTYKQITEALDPHHEYQADDWDHMSALSDDTIDKINNAMGGRHHVVLPIESDVDHGSIHPDVHEHLQEHGWNVTDYRKGMASKKVVVGDPSRGIPNREKEVTKSIGKILHETNAAPEVHNAFQNDPHRNMAHQGEHANYRAMISAHPYAIAHMSTNTPWESCMSMDTGSNRHYLEDDSRHGTHVAYLVHKDDVGLKTGVPDKPFARIALKRHDDADTGEDTVFRPEHSVYGSPIHGFEDTVHRWAKQAYPAKHNTEYAKHEDLYDNDGRNQFTEHSNEELGEMAKKMTLHRGIGYDLDSVKHIVKTIDDYSDSRGGHSDVYRSALLAIPPNKIPAHLANHMVNKIIDTANTGAHPGQRLDVDSQTYKAIGGVGKSLSGKTIRRVIDPANHTGIDAKALPRQILESPNLPQDIADTVKPNDVEHLHPSKVKQHHVDSVVNAYLNQASGSAYPLRALTKRGLIDKPNFNKVFAYDVRRADAANVATHMENRMFDEANHRHAIEHGNHQIVERVIGKSKFTTPEDIDKAISKAKISGDWYNPYPHSVIENNVASKVLLNKNASGDAVRHAFDINMNNIEKDQGSPTIGISEGVGKHLTDDHVKRMVDYHTTHDNGYGFSNVHDTELSNRMMDEHDKRVNSAIKDYNIANDNDELTDEHHDKLQRALDVHHEFLNDRFDNLFGDHSEEDLKKDPNFAKHVKSARHAHNENPINYEYEERHLGDY